jgi:hypothetical protein
MNGLPGVASGPYVWLRVSLVFNAAQHNFKESGTTRKIGLTSLNDRKENKTLEALRIIIILLLQKTA